MHPDYLLDYLTADQLLEWEAYDRLDPIGDERADYRMAYIVTAITNIARKVHGGRGAAMAEIADFMPRWGEEKGKPEKFSDEKMKETLMGVLPIGIKRRKRGSPPEKRRK